MVAKKTGKQIQKGKKLKGGTVTKTAGALTRPTLGPHGALTRPSLGHPGALTRAPFTRPVGS